MDLTHSAHPDSMVLGSGKIEITSSPVKFTGGGEAKTWELKELCDMGLARGIKMSFSSSQIDIKADNGTVPLKGQMDVKAKVEFSILERFIPLLGKVMGGIVKAEEVYETKTVDAKTFQLKVSFKGKDKVKGKSGKYVAADECKDFADYLKIKNAMEVGKAPASGAKKAYIEVESAKVKGKADAHVTASAALEWDETDKISKILITAEGAEEEDEITVSLKVSTPKEETKKLTGYRLSKGAGGVAQPVAMRITAKRKAGDGRIISRLFEFPYGFYSGDDAITLKANSDADSVSEVPMSFEFSPHPDMVEDENLIESSLYRETAEV